MPAKQETYWLDRSGTSHAVLALPGMELGFPTAALLLLCFLCAGGTLMFGYTGCLLPKGQQAWCGKEVGRGHSQDSRLKLNRGMVRTIWHLAQQESQEKGGGEGSVIRVFVFQRNCYTENHRMF